MGYSSGMMNKRVMILARSNDRQEAFGYNSGGTKWVDVKTVWAAVDWTKGVKAMREGAMDAYDSVMVRMRWNDVVNRESRLRYKGKVYVIDTFHDSKEDNTIQITATELVNP